jgi:glycosyltransferase involved in cell wall biosynthesis
VSPAMQDECRRRRIGSAAIHVVAESGMDIGRYANAQQPEDAQDLLKSPVGPDQKPFVLLNVARLEKGKGQRELLNAVRHIVEQHSNIVLLLAGEGQDRKAIEQEISSLGLEKHVRLLGHREDVERLLAIADVFSFASQNEGLPRSLVQAAIANVPIITTALPGVERLISHGKTGLIVPIGDTAGIGAAVLRLISNKELRARMKQELAARDYEPWAADTMCQKIDHAYSIVHCKSEPVVA